VNRVLVPSPLRSYTGGAAEVTGHGATVGEVMANLDREYPGMRFRMIDEQDRIRPHIKFAVGIEFVWSLDAPVEDGDDVHIIAALSGG
jgi:molybdopterin converting factor small subunit